MRKIIHKWKAFKTVAGLPKNGRLRKFNPRSDRAKKKKENPKSYISDSTGALFACSMLMRDRLKESGLFGGDARRKTFSV